MGQSPSFGCRTTEDKKPHWICNVKKSVYFCVCMWDHPKFVTFHEIIRETAAAQMSAAVFFKTINSMGNIYIIPSFRKPASAVSQFPQQQIRVKKIAASVPRVACLKHDRFGCLHPYPCWLKEPTGFF